MGSGAAVSARAKGREGSAVNYQAVQALIFASISAASALSLALYTDSIIGPVVVGLLTCALFHVYFNSPSLTSLSSKTFSSSAPSAGDNASVSTPVAAPASDGVPKEPVALPAAAASSPAAAAPVTAPGAGKGYLDMQGASPGARAMAAAMKAKASRGAQAQAAAAASIVRAPASRDESEVNKKLGLVVLYGSQTGNAAEIAKAINAEAVQRNLDSSVYALNQFSMEKLQSVSVAVFVVSSTGDGDPPENCDRMVAALQRKSRPQGFLAQLQYTVCGLGDSNYTRFMHVPRIFSRRLPELGARPFYPCCEADEVDGLEEVVDKWTAGLWGPLTQALHAPVLAQPALPAAPGAGEEGEGERLVGVAPLQPCRVRLLWQDGPSSTPSSSSASATAPSAASLDPPEGEGAAYTAGSPFPARVLRAQRLTAAWSDRCVLQMDLSLEGWRMALPRAGDSVGVLPSNSPALVEALVERLGVDPDREFVMESGAERWVEGGRPLSHIPSPCSLRRALTWHCDITGVAKKGLLRVLAEHASDPKDRHMLLLLSSRGGREKYKEWVVDARPSLLEILEAFPSCKPDLAHLLEALPPLASRFYSLCNSPLASAAETRADAAPVLSVAFSVVRHEMPLPPSWLAPVPPAGSAEACDAGKQGGEGEVRRDTVVRRRPFEGVCTTWLEKELGEHHLLLTPGAAQDEEEGDKASKSALLPAASSAIPTWTLPVYPRAGGSFRHPEDLSCPIIMIGPGTGVAPFRGFLQEREAAVVAGEQEGAGARGESWLFFGCRQAEEDYLYRRDLEAFVEKGVLSHLVLAFSRSPENKGSKVYVQHKMEEHKEGLGDLLFAPNTHVFVCGDGADMAKGVHLALLKIVQQHRPGLRESDAVAHMAAMLNQGRYIRDVWS